MAFSQVNYPNLHPGNHRYSGERSRKYNCIGWAVGRDDQWWDPAKPEAWEDFYFWPATAPRDYKITSLIVAFESAGFVVCPDGSLEVGIEKIVISADGPEYMHAARQLP